MLVLQIFVKYTPGFAKVTYHACENCGQYLSLKKLYALAYPNCLIL
jgi:hypothetical protein